MKSTQFLDADGIRLHYRAPVALAEDQNRRSVGRVRNFGPTTVEVDLFGPCEGTVTHVAPHLLLVVPSDG